MDAALLDVIATAIRTVNKQAQHKLIQPQSVLVDDLALDSLDLVGVLMKIEDHFHMKIDLDEVPNVRTVADLVEHVAVLRDQSAAA